MGTRDPDLSALLRVGAVTRTVLPAVPGAQQARRATTMHRPSPPLADARRIGVSRNPVGVEAAASPQISRMGASSLSTQARAPAIGNQHTPTSSVQRRVASRVPTQASGVGQRRAGGGAAMLLNPRSRSSVETRQLQSVAETAGAAIPRASASVGQPGGAAEVSATPMRSTLRVAESTRARSVSRAVVPGLQEGERRTPAMAVRSTGAVDGGARPRGASRGVHLKPTSQSSRNASVPSESALSPTHAVVLFGRRTAGSESAFTNPGFKSIPVERVTSAAHKEESLAELRQIRTSTIVFSAHSHPTDTDERVYATSETRRSGQPAAYLTGQQVGSAIAEAAVALASSNPGLGKSHRLRVIAASCYSGHPGSESIVGGQLHENIDAALQQRGFTNTAVFAKKTIFAPKGGRDREEVRAVATTGSTAPLLASPHWARTVRQPPKASTAADPHAKAPPPVASSAK